MFEALTTSVTSMPVTVMEGEYHRRSATLPWPIDRTPGSSAASATSCSSVGPVGPLVGRLGGDETRHRDGAVRVPEGVEQADGGEHRIRRRPPYMPEWLA